MKKKNSSTLKKEIAFYNVRMTPETYKKIKKSALDKDIYISEWFEGLIKDALEREDKREDEREDSKN